MSDHGAEAQGSSTPSPGNARGMLSMMFFGLAIVIGLIWWRVESKAAAEREKVEAAFAAESRARYLAVVAVEEAKDDVIYAKTPASLTLDYEFNLELEEPILMYYPGEKTPVRVEPGSPCETLRAPKYSGPKRFVTERDSEKGEAYFRVYRIQGGCK